MSARQSQPNPDALITMSEIADLASVSRSAASNWRRRFKDFPTSVETVPGGGDLFRLSEVEEWLRRHDRRVRKLDSTEIVWHAADALRATQPADRVLEFAFAALALHRLLADQRRPRGGDSRESIDPAAVSTPDDVVRLVEGVCEARPDLIDAFAPLKEPSATSSRLIQAIFGQTEPSDLGLIFEELLRRRSRARIYRRGEGGTSETLRELVVRLARPQRDQIILDPAVGEAGFLVDAALAATGPVRLAGQEVNPDTLRVGTLRLLAHGLSGDMCHGNSLLDDCFGDLRADLVVCDPPYGLRDWGAEQMANDQRWRFGLPSRQNADLAWIQHAVYHLGPEGRAYVLLPAGSLSRGGNEARIRFEFLKQGVVESVVALPPGLADASAVALSLWILRPSELIGASHVLLIDASGSTSMAGAGKAKRSLGAKTVDAIADALASWRTNPDGFESIPGFATSIPIFELLNTDAPIAPGRWVQTVSRADGAKIGSELEKIAERLAVSRRRMSDAPPVPASLPIVPANDGVSRWRIRDLAEEGHVSILRATRITPQDYRTQGTPVLMQSDLRGRSPGDEPKYVNVKNLKTAPVFTERGDVILATIGEKPYAVVDRKGGSVLGGSLQALRIHCDWLDPDVVAALLSSSRTAQFSVGVTVRHVKLRDLELPKLTPDETALLREILDRIEATEQPAGEAAESAASLKRGLVEGLVSGSIRLGVHPGNERSGEDGPSGTRH
jgi:hypothetical protein